MNKQQLAAKIWESANRMRGKVDASEYKDFILGFIFYKYLSEKEEQFFLGEGMTASDMEQLVEEDEETVGYAQNHLGYFISYQNLFSTWIQAGNDFAVSQVYEALSAFSRLVSPLYKNVFDGIFITLQTGLSKLGDNTGSQTKAVRDLVHLIQTIPMSTHQDYDVLGYSTMNLISKFASNARQESWRFYTPHEVSVLMADIVAHHLRSQDTIRIYDPTSGSGSLLITIGDAVKRRMGDADGIAYYAQELNQSTYNLTRMNLVSGASSRLTLRCATAILWKKTGPTSTIRIHRAPTTRSTWTRWFPIRPTRSGGSRRARRTTSDSPMASPLARRRTTRFCCMTCII